MRTMAAAPEAAAGREGLPEGSPPVGPDGPVADEAPDRLEGHAPDAIAARLER